jgi:hypothetical protein
MCITSVLFRSGDEYDEEEEEEEEEEEGVCEEQMQPTLRKSSYVKQIGKFLQQIL